MAFDFLGSPRTQDDIDNFRSFIEEELNSIDTRITAMESNISRMKRQLEKLIEEARDIGLQRIIDKSSPETMKETKNERNHFDVHAAEFMFSAKEPFVERIKESKEKLEFSIKRIYYAISSEFEKIDLLNEARTEALVSLKKAEDIINNQDLFEDTSSTNSDNR